MNIIHVNYKWRKEPEQRTETQWIVLHHTATRQATVDSIHRHHQTVNGWLGFGYHFFVNKAGLVFSGRPMNAQGAHVQGYNHSSIGVCFEGDFENSHMTQEQVDAGIELVRYIRGLYPEARAVRHADLNKNNRCPGENFRTDIITKGMQDPKKEVDEYKKALEFLKKWGEPQIDRDIVIRFSKIMERIVQIDRTTMKYLLDR